MVTGKIPYPNVQETIEMLRHQIVDSYPYAYENTPEFTNPEHLFEWLKFRTTYQKDPNGVELLQEMETMMEPNEYGNAGYGDCDCFTITTLACMAVMGWSSKQIILVGNKTEYPQHIYAGIKWQNQYCTLDLTNPYINMERKYKYKQIIRV